MHRMDGVFIAHGRDIRPGRLDAADILDVAPTVLHSMGLPVPRHMEGQVLSDTFEGPKRTGPVTYGDAAVAGRDRGAGMPHLGPGESRMLEDRLRDLGYL
jgi:hypothetical protein